MKRVLLTLFLLSPPLFAQTTYTCVGPVTDLVVSPNGVVTASIGSLAWVYLCAIGTTSNYNGVTSDACKAIYAHLLSAKTTGAQETFWFNDSLTCTTHPAWANLTGWYFGPDFQQ